MKDTVFVAFFVYVLRIGKCSIPFQRDGAALCDVIMNRSHSYSVKTVWVDFLCFCMENDDDDDDDHRLWIWVWVCFACAARNALIETEDSLCSHQPYYHKSQLITHQFGYSSGTCISQPHTCTRFNESEENWFSNNLPAKKCIWIFAIFASGNLHQSLSTKCWVNTNRIIWHIFRMKFRRRHRPTAYAIVILHRNVCHRRLIWPFISIVVFAKNNMFVKHTNRE